MLKDFFVKYFPLTKVRDESALASFLERHHKTNIPANEKFQSESFFPILDNLKENSESNSWVVFNSGLWDMRHANLTQYIEEVDWLADFFKRYTAVFPHSKPIWRSSTPTNWDRLDASRNPPRRAKERLLMADNVAVYNRIAESAMHRTHIPIWDVF